MYMRIHKKVPLEKSLIFFVTICNTYLQAAAKSLFMNFGHYIFLFSLNYWCACSSSVIMKCNNRYINLKHIIDLPIYRSAVIIGRIVYS